jgi:hypothetical protein
MSIQISNGDLGSYGFYYLLNFDEIFLSLNLNKTKGYYVKILKSNDKN